MWNIPNIISIYKLIPPNKNGYEFIKSLKLFIPYKEIGLQLLVRKELPLPFFYEIILKLIDCKCNSISDISQIIGVEEEILNDVAGEMSVSGLVYPKGNNLVLTPDGKKALNNLKKVIIEKEEINRVFINAISGDITEIEDIYKRPEQNQPCLYENITINDEFLIENFVKINDYYQKRQEEFGIKGASTKNEIYQILGKDYDKLCYSEKRLFIYRNIRDNDIVYECENDIDNSYGTIFTKQVDNQTGARRFLKKPSDIRKYISVNIYNKDKEKEKNTDELIKILCRDKTFNKEYIEDMENKYFTDRYMLENEYIEILYSIKNIKPTEILISSSDLSRILDSNIISLLQSSLDNTRVIIICDPREWNIDQLKGKVINNKQKKKYKIEWTQKTNIKKTDIVLYPHCSISIQYLPIPIGQDYLLKEIAEITFNFEKVKELHDILLDII